MLSKNVNNKKCLSIPGINFAYNSIIWFWQDSPKIKCSPICILESRAKDLSNIMMLCIQHVASARWLVIIMEVAHKVSLNLLQSSSLIWSLQCQLSHGHLFVNKRLFQLWNRKSRSIIFAGNTRYVNREQRHWLYSGGQANDTISGKTPCKPTVYLMSKKWIWFL